ncbi:MAG: SPOR domain-containing protein [Thermoanaerobaculia bacterium]
MEGPRTHYQVSLTARQAVGLFVGLLAALGVAYFFGLKTGLAGRDTVREAPLPAGDSPVPEQLQLPPIETAVPTASASLGSRTELAGGALAATPPPAEAPAPSTLEPFDDGSSSYEASPLAEASPGKASAPPQARVRPAPPASFSGKFWVQVASLASREEAGALSSRLSRRGFPSQLLTAADPRGKGRLYRVRVGPYASEAEAGRVADRLVRQEKLKGPWVVPDGK